MISGTKKFSTVKFITLSRMLDEKTYHNYKGVLTAKKSSSNSQTNRRATISTCPRDSHRWFTKQSRSCETLPDMKFFSAPSKIFIAKKKSQILAQIFLIFALRNTNYLKICSINSEMQKISFCSLENLKIFHCVNVLIFFWISRNHKDVSLCFFV